MYTTVARQIQLLPRATLARSEKIIPALGPWVSPAKLPTVHDILMERKAEAGASWPPNLRVEPFLKKDAFKSLPKAFRGRMKKLVCVET